MSTDVPHRYHHGALREALLRAGEDLLEEEGVAGLTLRAIARRAGVSHGAPAHHFADLAALLSDLAALGFRQLADRLTAALGTVAVDRFAVARAYVRFAREKPALFALMFRDDRLDANAAALRAARADAVAVLARLAGAPVAASLDDVGRMACVWAMVHGFAVLANDGRLTPLLSAAPPDTDVDAVLEAALRVLPLLPPGGAGGAEDGGS